MSQDILLKEVLDHTIDVLVRDGEVVGWGQAVPSRGRAVIRGGSIVMVHVFRLGYAG